MLNKVELIWLPCFMNNPFPSETSADDAEQFRAFFATKLNESLDNHFHIPKGYGRVAAVASLFNISTNTANAWLKGHSLPELWRMPGIAKLLNVGVEELLGGGSVSPMSIDDNYVSLDVHSQGSTADGTALYLQPGTLKQLRIPSGCQIMLVQTDEMAGFASTGDAVIYNPGVKRIGTNNEVYVLKSGDHLLLRRAHRNLRNEIRLSCEDPSIPHEVFQATDFTSNEESTDKIYVVGQVVGRILVRH